MLETATTPETAKPEHQASHLAAHWWKPGQSGNPAGRKKGTRHKLGQAFLEDMLEAWEKQGKAAIDAVIATRPQDFLKTVAQILPKQVEQNRTAVEDLSDDELAAALLALRSVLAVRPAGTGSKAPAE